MNYQQKLSKKVSFHSIQYKKIINLDVKMMLRDGLMQLIQDLKKFNPQSETEFLLFFNLFRYFIFY